MQRIKYAFLAPGVSITTEQPVEVGNTRLWRDTGLFRAAQEERMTQLQGGSAMHDCGEIFEQCPDGSQFRNGEEKDTRRRTRRKLRHLRRPQAHGDDVIR